MIALLATVLLLAFIGRLLWRGFWDDVDQRADQIVADRNRPAVELHVEIAQLAPDTWAVAMTNTAGDVLDVQTIHDPEGTRP